MKRGVVLLFLFALLPAARADTKPGDPIRLTVSPAAAPKPSLKYRLLPDRQSLTAGNAAAQYYRALALFYENPFLLKEVKEAYWQEWLDTPLADLPRKEMGEKLNQARHLLHEMEIGAGRRDCDWQLDNRKEGIGLVIPDVQGYRTVGVLLAARARYEIAEGRPDDALHTLQTGYALSRHLSQGPTLIHFLVGAAVARMMNNQLDELVQQPDAPNLYWTLTDLPRPFFDPQPVIEEDGQMMENMFPWVKKLDGPPMTDAQVQAAMLEVRRTLDDFGLVKPDELQKIAQAALFLQVHGEAKRFLTARKEYAAEQVDQMPTFQAVALFANLDYRESRDEMVKWLRAPNGRRHPGFKAAGEKYGQAIDRLDRLFFRGLLRGLSGDPVNPINQVYEAAERTDRRFAALTCVEALRLFAAQNGRWPTDLDEVKDVPLPVDPITTKPFEYKVQGARAVLTAPPIPGVKGTPTQAVAYELTPRK